MSKAFPIRNQLKKPNLRCLASNSFPRIDMCIKVTFFFSKFLNLPKTMFSLWQFIFRPREGENSQFYFYQNTSKAISKNPYHVHNYSQRLSPGIIEGRVYHKQVWKANRIRIFILFTKKTFRTRRQAGNTLQAHINNQLTTTPCQEIRQPNH